MNGFFCKAIFAVILCLGLLPSQASAADGTPIQMKYAGTGINTAVDTNSDGFHVGLTQANGQGTFGNFALASTTEFTPITSTGRCPTGNIELSLVYSATVQTFADQSQAFAIANDGWSCLNMSTGQYFGEIDGDYVGGTGRFEGATGEFTTPFNGVILDPAVGFESITGTIEGTVNRPAGGGAGQNRRGKP
jgi:hypothetical protein